MSLISETLQRAVEQQKEKNVIPVPRASAQNPWLTAIFFMLTFAFIAVLGQRIWNEQRERVQAETALAAQLNDLEQRHQDLVSRIYQSDAHLDTRLQLEMFDVKSELRKLSSQVDALNIGELTQLKNDSATMRDEVKDQIQVLNKRFHNNEREHFILNERIEALKAKVDGEAAPQ
jgi:chaperonin cofactor prefoldin